MLEINYEKCMGCGACVQRCPKQCITWKTGELGFQYPDINKKSCIDCGLCEKVCPIEKTISIPKLQKVYAAVHKNCDVLASSTSGGAFTAIADIVLEKGGVVYGASMEDGLKVRHIKTETKEELQKLKGSKYLQSEIGNSYNQVEKDLKQGRIVLFSGTPCQIDGLKNYLLKDYENLYTIDIVCHGVGSQLYFDKYMQYAYDRYGDIADLKFRSKEFAGWSCGGVVVVVSPENSKQERHRPYYDYDNYYYSYFLSGDIYRKSCYSCKYANTERQGDFTLGDYWGIEALNLQLETEKGCSLLIVNSEKAMRLLDKSKWLEMAETTIEQATRCNKQLNAPSELPLDRKKRVEEYNTLTGKEIQQIYMKTHKKYVLKGRLKSMMPYKLKLFLRSIRK